MGGAAGVLRLGPGVGRLQLREWRVCVRACVRKRECVCMRDAGWL